MNPQKTNPFLHWAIVLAGFTSVVAQVLLMRELMVVFYGNELSLGTILGTWLLWTAVGSALLIRILRKTHRPHLRVSTIQLILSLLLPFVFLFVRSSKGMLGITLGEMTGFVPMLSITLMTLAPFCLLSGLLYTTACQAVHNTEGNAPIAIGKVYLLEAIGAGIGGLGASFVLVRFLSPARIVLLLSLLNLVSAMLVGNLNPFRTARLRATWILLVSLTCGTFALSISDRFQRWYDRILWEGYDLVATQNTMFGNLAVTRMGDQFSFFENGLLVFTTPDRLTAEESVHFVLLEHPLPRKILLIGGGLGGGIQETLRHPSVESIDYVELDPAVVLLAERVLPPEQTQFLRNPRLRLHHVDGRRFVKQTDELFDVIIMNLPNPYTAQLNRLYTLEFFREIHRKLTPGGVFSLQVTSSENVIGPELSDFLSILSTTLKSVFPDIVVIPGETNRFIASNRPGQLTSDPQLLIQRLRDRNLQTLYVREYYVPYQMSEERQAYLRRQIHTVPPNRLNKDFKPVGYFYDTILWATTFSSAFKKLFLAFARLRVYHLTGLVASITLILILLRWHPTHRTHLFAPAVLYAVFGVGFTEISLEVILILGFQVLYGYVYQQLAVIIAGYMVGLAIGSRAAISEKPPYQRTFHRFRLFQLLMCLYPLVLAGILKTLHHLSASAPGANWMNGLFPLLAAGAGFIGGYQFPLANRLYLRTGQPIQRVAGFLYSFDLIGSSAGAIITSAFLIPILGIFPTLILLAVINFCALLVVLMSKETAET